MFDLVRNTKRASAGLLVGCFMAVGFQAPATASALAFLNFDDLTGLQLNGAASVVHGCSGGIGATCSPVSDLHGHSVLRLTNDTRQSGSAFTQNTISLASNASFSTSFQFHFTDQQNTGADGIVFVLQTQSNTAGSGGIGIGYGGLTNSIGIEFDNWNNFGIDNHSDNHVGINVGGSLDSAAINTDPGFILDSGDLITAWVDYDGANNLLEVRANTTGFRPDEALLSLGINLSAELQATEAFVGFTSGTGSAGADHDIVAWRFNNSLDPIQSISAPASMAILSLGIVILGVSRRRQN